MPIYLSHVDSSISNGTDIRIIKKGRCSMKLSNYVTAYECGGEISQHSNCIYMYVNKINNKKYVGQAKNLTRRHSDHLKECNNKYPIDKAIKKYGKDSFELIVLKENVKSLCVLNMYETYYIKKFNTLVTNKEGYNIADGGHSGNTWAGKTEEEMLDFKQKMSELNSGRKRPQQAIESQREKIRGENNGFYGKKHSDETKKLLSEIASKRTKEKNHFYGKTHSDESRSKISESRKGKCVGEENGFYGKKHSEETKEKIRQARVGKKIAQFDKEGNLIKVWDYAKLASDELGIDQTTISRCCKGKQKTASGYIWKYLDELDNSSFLYGNN